MADATVAALQHTINRFASAPGGFPRIATDGLWGTNTRTALNTALRWVVDHVQDPRIRQIAADFQVKRGFDDPNAKIGATTTSYVQVRNFVLTSINNFMLTPVADSLEFKEVLPSSGGGGGGSMIPADGTNAGPPSPIPDPSGKASSISVLGLQLPRWALYLGGGALALAVIGLVATRKKSASTPLQPARCAWPSPRV